MKFLKKFINLKIIKIINDLYIYTYILINLLITFKNQMKIYII